MKNRFLFFIVIFLLFSKSFYAQYFTIPVFPDTQRAVNVQDSMFYSQIDWIVSNRDRLNIPFVLHVGDLVDYNNYIHWDIASKGFEIFDKHNLPYAIALGNHDTGAVGYDRGSAAPGNVNQNLRNTDKFNSYFPVYRFKNQRGRYEVNKSDNAYYTFSVDSTFWLVLTLEFCPRLGVINWAEDVVAAYSDYNIIILTHYYLDKYGNIVKNNAGYGDFSPQVIFERLVSKYPNICLVLSGHTMHTALRIDTGIKGNKIYQILSDYQNEDRGGGYLRLLHFDLDNNTLKAEMYSPYYNTYKNDSSFYFIKNFNVISRKL